jgi:hypothetical protein
MLLLIQNDYLRMAESANQDNVCKFCRAIVKQFGSVYLRAPEQDAAHILAQNKAREFLGMLGSINYMHRARKNCKFAS